MNMQLNKQPNDARILHDRKTFFAVAIQIVAIPNMIV